jgi:flagellar hook-length control protein FliK
MNAVSNALSNKAAAQLSGGVRGAADGKGLGAAGLFGNGKGADGMKGMGEANGQAVTAATTQAAQSNPSAGDAAAAAAAAAAETAGSTATPKENTDAINAALAAVQGGAAATGNALASQAAKSGAGASAAASLAPEVGSQDWDEALSQKVVFMSNAHQQSAELTLNPADLGPLQVVLQVADNHAHALFVSQHQQVREAVEAALPKLREAMEQNGIGLGSTSVSDGFARQTGQQERQGGGNSGGRGGYADAADSSATAATVSVPTRRKVGLVDTFA